MPSCPDCGANTTIAFTEEGQKLILDTYDRRATGEKRWRLQASTQVPRGQVARPVSPTFSGREMIEHAQICRQPLHT